MASITAPSSPLHMSKTKGWLSNQRAIQFNNGMAAATFGAGVAEFMMANNMNALMGGTGIAAGFAATSYLIQNKNEQVGQTIGVGMGGILGYNAYRAHVLTRKSLPLLMAGLGGASMFYNAARSWQTYKSQPHKSTTAVKKDIKAAV